MTEKKFDADHVIHELKHYLPSQTPIKDFIHHNSLHAFQQMKFFDAIFTAADIFGYQVTLQLEEYRKLYSNGRINTTILENIISDQKGKADVENWKNNLLQKDYDTRVFPRIGKLRSWWKEKYHIDLDTKVQPLLFRILCSYLDQGVSVIKFPVSEFGFLDSLKQLEKTGITSFFKTKKARTLLLSGAADINILLKRIVGDEQMSHRGWSGIVSAIESMPETLLDSRKISLKELIIFELLLETDTLDYYFGNNWAPLCTQYQYPPVNLFDAIKKTELQEVFLLWQQAFEWSYYDEVLSGIANGLQQPLIKNKSTSFQAIFCIDERECSLRRHIESVDTDCETLGSPGFFGVEFYYKPEGGNFYDKLCPAPVTPKYLIKEFDVKVSRKHELLYTNKTQTLFTGFFSVLSLGFFSCIRLFQNIFSPKMSPAISNAFTHMDKHAKLTIENKQPDDKENNLQIGFTVEEMAIRVEGLLSTIGLIENFAPLVYVLAHGSSSANNPHHGAHDCGACSGRPGSINARVFAFMANHEKVRILLKEKGLSIPLETQFIGGLHDTAADQIEFYDEDILSPVNKKKHAANITSFETALDLNAKERSRRFSSIKTKNNLSGVRKAILHRSVSMFEPRPELGHGTNSLCIIGSRNLSKTVFLDRRAFLNSYDYKTDADGKLLTGLMKPIGPVCGGINLEYYFSRVDNYKLGAGTKLPHNVMGLIGVANSADGDLRPGLPLQMIEVHDPVRLLVIVHHFPDVVLKTIQAVPEMYEWYINEWVHLMVIHPESNRFYYFKDGRFSLHPCMKNNIPVIKDIQAFIESAPEMETNHITDATKENLPVYSLI